MEFIGQVEKNWHWTKYQLFKSVNVVNVCI